MRALFSKLSLSKGLVAGLFLGTVVGSIGVAAATASPTSAKFYACLNVKAGTMNSINTTGAPKCGKGNVGINWNVAGQQGIPGSQGPAGPQGAPASQSPDLLIQGGQVQTPSSACALFAQTLQGYGNYPTISCTAISTVASSALPAGIEHYAGSAAFGGWASCDGLTLNFIQRQGTYIPYSTFKINPVDPREGYTNDTFFPLQEGDRIFALRTCFDGNIMPNRAIYSAPGITQVIEPIWFTHEPDLQIITAP